MVGEIKKHRGTTDRPTGLDSNSSRRARSGAKEICSTRGIGQNRSLVSSKKCKSLPITGWASRASQFGGIFICSSKLKLRERVELVFIEAHRDGILGFGVALKLSLFACNGGSITMRGKRHGST